MWARYGIEVVVCDEADQVYGGAHIVAALTESVVPVLNGALIEKGVHIVNAIYSERGNLQEAQFFGIAGRVYERAKATGRGHELPTSWFVQDIRN